MKEKYICPFCKMEIEDSIDSLVAHRAENGVCDQRMALLHPEYNDMKEK